jgi:hypothetical protein
VTEGNKLDSMARQSRYTTANYGGYRHRKNDFFAQTKNVPAAIKVQQATRKNPMAASLAPDGKYTAPATSVVATKM